MYYPHITMARTIRLVLDCSILASVLRAYKPDPWFHGDLSLVQQGDLNLTLIIWTLKWCYETSPTWCKC